jgi:hypothetical protein
MNQSLPSLRDSKFFAGLDPGVPLQQTLIQRPHHHPSPARGERTSESIQIPIPLDQHSDAMNQSLPSLRDSKFFAGLDPGVPLRFTPGYLLCAPPGHTTKRPESSCTNYLGRARSSLLRASSSPPLNRFGGVLADIILVP